MELARIEAYEKLRQVKLKIESIAIKYPDLKSFDDLRKKIRRMEVDIELGDMNDLDQILNKLNNIMESVLDLENFVYKR